MMFKNETIKSFKDFYYSDNKNHNYIEYLNFLCSTINNIKYNIKINNNTLTEFNIINKTCYKSIKIIDKKKKKADCIAIVVFSVLFFLFLFNLFVAWTDETKIIKKTKEINKSFDVVVCSSFIKL